ncbi:DMT family transporter [Paracoccus zhejiangensis]|uniref:EamA family transporter n=1 Tax=Paracoccus zhejiangensis TaxID=1077935 RepID=A0A2H5EXF0_9RHOB|nr:DMT family transporter [Paracoccus zhejiangensis]AUH63957.1 EamA family transporter [Paracoccus zhejiangensis]
MTGNARAAGLMVLGMAFFAIEDLLLKLLAVRLSIGEVLFLHGALGAVLFALLIRLRGQPTGWQGARRPVVLLRSLGEGLTALTFVAALALGDLASVSAITQALPLAMTMGGALILGEHVGWRRWLSVALGFLGVLMIMRPGTEAFHPAALLALASVFFAAMRDLTTRRVPVDVGSGLLTITAFTAIALSGLVLMAVEGQGLRMLDLNQWLLLLACVFVGLAGYQAMVVSVRLADLSLIAPFRYTRLVFALILAVLVLRERPDLWTLAGAGVIVLSGVYAMWREAQLRRRAARRA